MKVNKLTATASGSASEMENAKERNGKNSLGRLFTSVFRQFHTANKPGPQLSHIHMREVKENFYAKRRRIEIHFSSLGLLKKTTSHDNSADGAVSSQRVGEDLSFLLLTSGPGCDKKSTCSARVAVARNSDSQK